jgi:hypothetical protein
MTYQQIPLNRRHCLVAAAGLGLTRSALGADGRRYVVVAFIGDRLEFVYAVMGTGSMLNRNQRQIIPDAKGSFDQIALKALGLAIEKTEPKAAVSLVQVPPSVFHEQPEKLFDGQSVALPDGVINAIDQFRATHVILLTKERSDARLPIADGYLGVGSLRGLGYYLDGAQPLKSKTTGDEDIGFIASYAHMRLTLADARTGTILKQRSVTAARVYSVVGSQKALNPWDVLSTEQKVERLQNLIEKSMSTEVPQLIAAN